MRELSYGILIGGKSKRMGSDKASLIINGETFLEHIAKEFEKKGDVIISGRKPKSCYLPYVFVEDQHEDIGPIEGIYNIISHSKTEYIFICACDMPNLKYELAAYLKEYISSDYECYAVTDGVRVHPLCCIYSKKILPVLEGMIEAGNYRLMDILNSVSVKYIDIRKSCYPVSYIENINTRDEYKEMNRPVLFCVSGRKNSGKTTLIRQLIIEYKKQAYKVGVIKHDGHDFNMDHTDTDTYMFTQAGADITAIYSKEKSAILHKKKNQKIDDIIFYMQDMDIVIIEGLKDSTFPKIEILRSELSRELISNKENMLAVIVNGDMPENTKTVHKNIFAFENTKIIANYILTCFHM